MMKRARRRFRRFGFTLVELIASIVILGVLGATITPIIVASSSQLSDVTTQRTAADTARDTLERIIRIIDSATSKLKNPDNNLKNKKVLFLVADSGGVVNPQEQRRIDLFTAWKCIVTTAPAAASQASLLASAATSDVIYISEEITSTDLNTKLTTTPTGIVTESAGVASSLEMAPAGAPLASQDTITVTDATHLITSVFGLGGLIVLGVPHTMVTMDANTGAHAPGLQALGDTGGAPTLAALPLGATTTTGSPAAGARVFLSLGAQPMMFEHVSHDSLRLVARAMEWVMTGSEFEDEGHTLKTEIKKAQPTLIDIKNVGEIKLLGTTLWFTPTGGVAALMANNVTTFALSYFGADGVTSSASDPKNIHRVDIQLVINGFELRGSAAPRAWRVQP